MNTRTVFEIERNSDGKILGVRSCPWEALATATDLVLKHDTGLSVWRMDYERGNIFWADAQQLFYHQSTAGIFKGNK